MNFWLLCSEQINPSCYLERTYSLMRNRLPPLVHILPVYAVISFVIYGWTILLTLWKLPSWLFSLHTGEIIAILSYSFLLNLIESLLVLLVLLGVCWLLPSSWLRNDFNVRGVVLTLVLFASMMLHLGMYNDSDLREAFVRSLLPWWGVTLLVAVGLTWLASKAAWLRRGILELSDRLIVFLYIFVPLSFLALIVVIVRNLH